MEYNNLTIIGTSHISKDSVEEVRKAIEEKKPGIVAVELDRKRAHALMHNIKPQPRISDIRRIGLNGYLFALIGSWLQKKLGNIVGVEPGTEMKTAIETAQKSGAKVALIDQDIEITLTKFSKAFTWKEKLRMARDAIMAPFGKKESLDLTKVPEKKIIKKYMNELKKHYPSIHRVLIQERNELMAERLAQIMSENPEERILTVLGAGHEEDVLALVRKKLKAAGR